MENLGVDEAQQVVGVVEEEIVFYFLLQGKTVHLLHVLILEFHHCLEELYDGIHLEPRLLTLIIKELVQQLNAVESLRIPFVELVVFGEVLGELLEQSAPSLRSGALEVVESRLLELLRANEQSFLEEFIVDVAEFSQLLIFLLDDIVHSNEDFGRVEFMSRHGVNYPHYFPLDLLFDDQVVQKSTHCVV